MGQFSVQEMTTSGSNFNANQHQVERYVELRGYGHGKHKHAH
jgi:hypothetical protein